MTRSPEPLDTDCDREREDNRYQIMYLVKRASYEFVFSVPTTRAAYLSGEQAHFQARFRNRLQVREFVLDLKALEDFYESLSCLMEYVNVERRRCPQKY